jgi:hypothetical protein
LRKGVVAVLRIVSLGVLVVAVSVLVVVPGSASGASSRTLREDGLTARPDLRRGEPVRVGSVGLEIPSQSGLGTLAVVENPDGESEVAVAVLSDDGVPFVGSGDAVSHIESEFMGTKSRRLGRSTTNSGECDNTYQWGNLGYPDSTPFKWFQTYEFWVNHSGRPSGVGYSAFRDSMVAADLNWFQVHNNCGAADGMGLASSFKGDTSVGTNFVLLANGHFYCQDPFGSHTGVGSSVTQFREMGADSAATAGMMCAYFFSTATADGTFRSVRSADIALNDDDIWTTTLSGCSSKFLVEDVLTHEIGHVLGFAHVFTPHGDHTMWGGSDPYCQNYATSLAKGDYLAANIKY